MKKRMSFLLILPLLHSFSYTHVDSKSRKKEESRSVCGYQPPSQFRYTMTDENTDRERTKNRKKRSKRDSRENPKTVSRPSLCRLSYASPYLFSFSLSICFLSSHFFGGSGIYMPTLLSLSPFPPSPLASYALTYFLIFTGQK